MGIGSCNLQIIIPFSNGELIFASFWLSFKRFDQDWKSLKTHIIAYNDEFYLPKSFTLLDSEDIFNIGRYFLMMLKKKEALFQLAVVKNAGRRGGDQHLELERAQMEQEDFRMQLLSK